MCSTTWKFSESQTSGLSWRLHHVGMIIYLLNFQTFSLLWRRGRWTKNTKLLIMAWFYWWLALIQELNKSHHIRTKVIPIAQKFPSDLEAPYQELRAETNTYIWGLSGKVLSLLIWWEGVAQHWLTWQLRRVDWNAHVRTRTTSRY